MTEERKGEQTTEPTPATTTITRETTSFQNPDLSFKLIFVGETSTGKTCMIKRLVYNQFEETHSVTIGGDFINVYFDVQGKKIKVQLWDTCGLEQYRSVVRLYFKGAHAALIAYDMSREKTSETIKGWNREIRENTVGSIPIYLVGTKSDLGPNKVSEDVLSEMVSSLEMAGRFETSSRTGERLAAMLDAVVLKLFSIATTEGKSKTETEQRLRVEALAKGRSRKKKDCC